MCINSDLKCIERAFLSLPNDGALAKDNVLVNSIKGMLKADCNCILLGNVIESNFEESLSTLQ